MSFKTVVDRVQEAIDNFLPSFQTLKLEDIVPFAQKAGQLASVFPGVEPTTLVTEINSEAKNAAESYFKILDEAPRRVSTEPSEIRAHLTKCGEVLSRFDKLLTLVKGEAVEFHDDSDDEDEESEPIESPTVIIPSGMLEIENALGKNFHGEEFWNRLGVTVKTPSLALYPRLTKAFLDGAFEYNPELKRSEAGTLIITPAKQSFNTFVKLTNEYCDRLGKNPAFYGADWRQDEDFANEVSSVDEIHFVLKDIVADSTAKKFEDQIALRKPGLIIAGAKELAEAICMQYLGADERIYKFYGRTKDLDSDGARIVVGCSYANGARIESNQDESGFDNVGLALAWNLKKRK